MRETSERDERERLTETSERDEPERSGREEREIRVREERGRRARKTSEGDGRVKIERDEPQLRRAG